jgi:leucyl-tRNA synthetase
METISMTKGSGIVTSVPSDAPDDWVSLREFQKDEKARQKFGVTEDMVKFDPVAIITTPGYTELPAVELCDKYEIKNPKDKEKLTKAKDEIYSKGFYSGIMNIGEYKGMKVNDAKIKIKADLIGKGLAVTYYEPEGLVKNRVGETCIVALVDQWYIPYGEETWRDKVLQHINSENFNAYSPSTLKGFNDKVNWLKEWGCSRTFGLGSRIPWDQQYLIESLSDSTIYMSYYTIANFIHEDMYGNKAKNELTADMFTEEVFDYIYLGRELKESKIPKELLDEMRESFNYWYPMDLRSSGKDLIGNHLTMSLYNHAAVWNDPKYWTRGYFCNGYILVNKEKMSKQKGNFFTIGDIVNKYGCDASRIGLADCGDGLDDANFATEIADTAINRLYSFENFIKILVHEHWEKTSVAFTDPDVSNEYPNYFDRIFDNNINFLVEKTKQAYESMRYKDVLKYAFYEMIVKYFI